MGFSSNKISPITFDVENPQTPVDCGTKGRALTSTPRERRISRIAQQGQTHNGVANLNEAHHKPQGNASYNPDESINNKHVQGRFIPPKVGNMSTQPQQQQSSSEEGSKENTILNRLRHQKERSAQGHPSGQADSVPQVPAPTAPTHTSQTGGPPQAPPVNNPNRDHQDPPECNGTTNGPPEHLWIVKAQELLKEGTRHWNLTLEHHQVQVQLHSILNHLRTLLYVQHVAKVAIGAEIAPITIFVTFVGLPPTLHICVELVSVESDHQSVYTVVKLTIAQLIVGTDQGTTEKSPEIHQMH